MHDSPAGIEARLRVCEDALAALTRRISTLEHASDTGLPPEGESEASAIRSIDFTGFLSLAGRTFVILGGAFLLRALTDAGALPGAGGVGLGLAYAAAWLVVADYAALRRPASGLVHGLTGVLIGLPLLWEASMRFHLLPPVGAGLALAGLTALALGVAWHRHLQLLAGIATCGAVVTALALGFAGDAILPNLIVLLAVSWASSWLSHACHWPWLKWPAALAASVTVAIVAGRAGGATPMMSPAASMGISVLLVTGVLAASGARLVVRREPVRAFDAIDTLLALLAGAVACLVAASHVGSAAPAAVRASFVALGAAGYGVAFFMRQRHPQARTAFDYYATLGLAMMVWGSSLMLAGAARDVALTALAVASLWLATRADRSVLAIHAAVYALAAALSAGVIAYTAQIWFGSLVRWPAFPLPGWLVLIVVSLAVLIPRVAQSRGLDRALSVSRLVLGVVLVGSLTGVLVLLAGPAIAGTPPDPGPLASLKTLILSCAAVALAVMRRVPFAIDLGRLAYPMLVAGGVKLLAEDLRVSSPSTLFIALAAYGMALLLTARIARVARPPHPDVDTH